jgi:hypothetical protein
VAVLARHGVTLTAHDDTMLMAYALDGGRGGSGLDELSAALFDHTPIAFKEVAGSGKGQVTFDRVALDRATAYAAEDADSKHCYLRVFRFIDIVILVKAKVLNIKPCYCTSLFKYFSRTLFLLIKILCHSNILSSLTRKHKCNFPHVYAPNLSLASSIIS